ncbi:MAG: FUSC family protein [Oscillospiraceae bacterium]|nr:FUSC family protein [Oscillospiraceae bacterium]
MDQNLSIPKERYRLPRIGQRIIKTAIAVFICLIINSVLRGQEGDQMSTEAIITAIICIQPHIRDSRYSGLTRFLGSLIGVVWALFILLLFLDYPILSRNRLVMYGVMTLGIVAVIYTAVALRMPDTAGLAAIIYSCVIMVYPDIEDPLYNAGIRMVDIFIGTAVAVSVNGFHLPRRKKRDKVFFLRTGDLVPDRFASLPPAVIFHLNSLIQDGAKIVLISEHAPAFFTLQLSAAKLNAPIITMDGAAIYDTQTNEFLYMEPIPTDVSIALRRRLDAIGCSYFIYTIHKNKLCIFHQGKITEQEQVIYDRMKRSPYRSYLEGEIYETEEIVYYKLIAAEGMIAGMQAALQGILNEGTLRSVIRPQSDAPGISALYLYSAEATVRHAENVMMWMLRNQNPSYQMEEIFAREPYRTEMDALHLLRRLGNAYEPLLIQAMKETRENEKQ